MIRTSFGREGVGESSEIMSSKMEVVEVFFSIMEDRHRYMYHVLIFHFRLHYYNPVRSMINHHHRNQHDNKFNLSSNKPHSQFFS